MEFQNLNKNSPNLAKIGAVLLIPPHEGASGLYIISR